MMTFFNQSPSQFFGTEANYSLWYKFKGNASVGFSQRRNVHRKRIQT